ncbi:2-octaprenyl-3-methyl-6-methoxy-1,4-benzoquinol hydroxylase [Neorhizobium sp. R1-B]|uniref:UbiH/UbiF family hydroxylase n=1 Tax=unclassified Neorhizobium TaxID=2629175 RepID=UPI000DD88C26|nr:MULTISPECIES: UbiH/UbiF family hydroxylase [unclassified Neorhizobium]TCV64447.1 2-octaprenyl-3-methyl-6-methoxy-1,4-benzoquinol hydroxylase [Neorhizobium sp. S3-V5DH]TDX74169.1 2-octaprenyl-3-methyl-6-methoxy-1,4-benzoquinol hydroxylase [Neorhizobium sp. R1-B]
MQHFEIAVVGGGLAGSVAALALARSGRKLAFIAPALEKSDERTTALMDQSIRFLERLGVWENIAPSAAPLSVMQILDATKRLLRAPTAQFRALDVGLYAFGYNIPNNALTLTLDAAVAAEPNITKIEQSVETLDYSAERVAITLAGGSTITTDFVVGADGRKSKTRDAAGIGTRTWSYPQSALVLNFSHTLPHSNVSTEFHTETGPFTQVPLPGLRSSLVWVVKPEEAQRLIELPSDQLSRRVEDRMQSILGKVAVEGTPQIWPLSSLMADRFGKGRLALIGEAAHAFPPIGAQGLNLSLRDVIALTELLAATGDRPIAADAGDQFNRRRRPDVMSRTFGVDILNRSLLSDFLPVQMLRAAGLHILGGAPPLRNLLMREGIEPGRGFRAVVDALRNEIRR